MNRRMLNGHTLGLTAAGLRHFGALAAQMRRALDRDLEQARKRLDRAARRTRWEARRRLAAWARSPAGVRAAQLAEAIRRSLANTAALEALTAPGWPAVQPLQSEPRAHLRTGARDRQPGSPSWARKARA